MNMFRLSRLAGNWFPSDSRILAIFPQTWRLEMIKSTSEMKPIISGWMRWHIPWYLHLEGRGRRIAKSWMEASLGYMKNSTLASETSTHKAKVGDTIILYQYRRQKKNLSQNVYTKRKEMKKLLCLEFRSAVVKAASWPLPSSYCLLCICVCLSASSYLNKGTIWGPVKPVHVKTNVILPQGQSKAHLRYCTVKAKASGRHSVHPCNPSTCAVEAGGSGGQV